MATIQEITIQDAFSKGFVDGGARNKISPSFAKYIRNWRIINQSVYSRNWYTTRIEDTSGTYIRWIIWNNVINKLVVATNWKLYEADITNAQLTEIGDLTWDTDVTMITHGKYIMVFDWQGGPYVYDWSTLKNLYTSTI